jgi:tetratricopeptide (TPR) repeat protein
MLEMEADSEMGVKCIPIACLIPFLLNPGLSLPQASGPKSTGSQATGSRGTASPSSGAVQQALALEQQGKYPEAQAAWESVVKAQPRNAQAYAHLGLLEAREQRYAEAIAHYRKAKALVATQEGAIPQLNLNLGLALFKSGNFSEASKLFQAELKKHPEDGRLTILMGMSYYGAHEYAAAIPYLKEAAVADQRNLPLRLTLAHCYLWTKQLDATMDVYKEILTINPDSAEADMIAGEALDEKGDNAGAVQQFRAAVKANPKEPNVHFGLAYLLWAQKRYDEAIPEFRAELENDPKNYQAMTYLGDTYVQQNQFDQAKGVLETAVQHQDWVPLLHLDLGIVYSETGSKDAAIRELEKTVSLESDNVNAHFRLAKMYQSMGKREEAKAEFAKASSLNKKTDEGLYKRIADANARPDREAKPPPIEAAKPEAAKPQ